MPIRSWLWGKRGALAGGATLVMLLHTGMMPLLHLTLLPLIAAGALGAVGAVSGNPWLILAAVLVALAVVAWRARRHENRTTQVFQVFQSLAGSYGYLRVQRKAAREGRIPSTAVNLPSRQGRRHSTITWRRSNRSGPSRDARDAREVLLKGARGMHSFVRRLHGKSGEASAQTTKGLVLRGGWRYDLHGWFLDTFLFRGQGRKLRQRTATLADIQPGEAVLDVGCGTGTLAMEVARRVGRAGRVMGIDPGAEQIARARAKAAQDHVPIDFQIGVIEQLPFPDQTFDVALSTLMMHHVGKNLKRQGLAEIVRVLKPGGRLVIADFTRKQDRAGLAARFHAGGSGLQELAALVADAGFSQVETEEMQAVRFSGFPGAGLIRAHKR